MLTDQTNTVNSTPEREPESARDLLALVEGALAEFSDLGRRQADSRLIDALITICRYTHDSTDRPDFEVRYIAFVIAARALDQVGGPQFRLSPVVTAVGRHPAFREVLAR